MASDFVTNQEIIIAARRNLTDNVWHYLTGGAESETTMRRNRFGFDSLVFSSACTGRRIQSRPISNFSGPRPLDSRHARADRVAAVNYARGRPRRRQSRGRVRHDQLRVSSVTQPSLEDIAVASPNPKIFQLYVQGDLNWVENLLSRVKQAGYSALCLTVDTAHYGRRERQMMDRWLPPSRRGVGYEHRAGLTWETLDTIKRIAGLPFILKGVATAEDAALAVEHGVSAIYVSNHGGRQLDHGRATIDMLPEIVDAAGDRAEIILDGGIVRGSDVLKAIALGARAVTIGKLQGWGLAAAGQPGLVRVLEILKDEIITTMGLLGVTRLDQLNSNYLCKVEPIPPAHEMSAFPHMPGGRLL